MTPLITGRLSGRSTRLTIVTLAIPSLILAWAAWWPLPPLFSTENSTVLLDRRGELLGATVAPDGQWRFPLRDTVPTRFATCILEFEDRHFRDHQGIHLPSLVRAFFQNRRVGRVVSGGSTLTMQLARLSMGQRPRSYGNKFIEALFALRIDLSQDKDRILALYCAHAPFGGNVVGLDAAAWRYYGRPPERLSWSECATLAVLPNAPASIYPGKAQDALRAKRDRLLSRLLAIGALDSTEWSLAQAETLPQGTKPLPRRAPHLLATLVAMGHAGKLLHTTLDGALQDRVTADVERMAPLLVANEVHNAAALVLDMPTGEVLAYVGNLRSAGSEHAGAMDLVRAERSTGSLLKPFLYADMLGSGELLPDMLVADVPTQYEGFAPHNYDESFAGALPASQALARSLNVPAVRALQHHGVDRTLRTLRGMGLAHLSRSADHYGLSLIIGGAESTLWELTGAYASVTRIVHQFGRSGNAHAAGAVHPPLVLQGVPKAVGIQDASSAPLSAASIYFTLKALRDVKRPESEAGWEVFRGQHRIAWKTGTSVGHRDAWAIGMSGRYTIGIWTGNASGEGRPGLTGTLAAAPLLFDLFGRLPNVPLPGLPYDELVRATTCRGSGHLAGPDCLAVDTVLIQEQGVRTPVCPYHRAILLDQTGRSRVRPGKGGVPTSWMVLPPAMEHYVARRDPSYRPLPPFADGGAEDQDVMEVLYPEQGARLFLPTELDGAQGRTVVHVTHRETGAVLDWDLDGTYAGRTTVDHQMALSPAEGAHRLTLTDQHGNKLERRFTVIASARTRTSE